MTDILADLTSLRKTVELRKEALIRAQAKADAAEATEAQALADLKELGCESPQDAIDQAKAVQKSVAEMTATIKAKLEEAVSAHV